VKTIFVRQHHAIYWPALLLSAGLPLPDQLVIHGFLTANGRKISKSLGNTVDPRGVIARYGLDAVRYYLLRGVSPFDDGDYAAERLATRHRQDLANNLGNVLNRVTTLAARSQLSSVDYPAVPDAPPGCHEAIAGYAFDRALSALWDILNRVNQEIEHREPWKLLKTGDHATLHAWLREWANTLYCVGYWLSPFLPSASEQVLTALSATPLVPSGALFPRLEG